MKLPAAEFKAGASRCSIASTSVERRLASRSGGRVVAELIPAGETDERLCPGLAGTARWHGDPLAPAVDETEVEARR
jgi:hypothetical protein